MSESYAADTFDALAETGEAADILHAGRVLFAQLAALDESTRMDTVNALRAELHQYSPMKDEPVDCVMWVPADQVVGNAYNPNVVAPPEMKLLELSIGADGFTQPIVAWPVDGGYEVVDGFHRHLVGQTKKIGKRLRGRLPIALIRSDRADLADRQAATFRHNRARGLHTVDGTSEIVLHLGRLGKTNEWIGRELGMDADEVLKMRQVTGLAEAFADQELSEAWEANTDLWAPIAPGPGDDT